MTGNVQIVSPDDVPASAQGGCHDGGSPCGHHHPRDEDPRTCCCGAEWVAAMTCHPCRISAHGDCVDGGRVDGPGRWCSCQHKEVTADGRE